MADTQDPGAAPRPDASRSLPQDALILLPVRQAVLFPGTIMPLVVGRPASIAAVQEAVRAERLIGVVSKRTKCSQAACENAGLRINQRPVEIQ